LVSLKLFDELIALSNLNLFVDITSSTIAIIFLAFVLHIEKLESSFTHPGNLASIAGELSLMMLNPSGLTHQRSIDDGCTFEAIGVITLWTSESKAESDLKFDSD